MDFKAMYEAEKKKRAAIASPSTIALPPASVFNILNDMRHLLIYDLRGEAPFVLSHIRDSFLLRDPGKEEALFKASSIIIENDLNLGTDSLRRLLLVHNEGEEILTSAIVAGQKLFDKVYSIKGGFKEMARLFPFVLVTDSSLEYLRLSDIDMKLAHKTCLSVQEKKVQEQVRAKSRYPLVVALGELYIGSFIHIMNERQMREMEVQTIVGLTENKELKIPGEKKPDEDSKEGGIDYVRFELSEKAKPVIEFEEVCETIEERKKPAFVFCMSGMMAAAVGIYFLMKRRNVSREVATMIVMKGRPQIEAMPAWLYSQLRVEPST